eukprot:Sspe_Gene.110508::Locus_91560_Transcript_1_1_Confidence_1.000_Length_498::g.110508::m.110508
MDTQHVVGVVWVLLMSATLASGCTSSEPVCSAAAPVFTPASTGECVGATSPCRALPTPDQIKVIVEQHNIFRAHHGACPIVWNQQIAEWSKDSPAFKQTCTPGGSMQHNSNLNVPGLGRLGENLAMRGGGGLKGVHNYDPGDGIRSWYCKEEGCY